MFISNPKLTGLAETVITPEFGGKGKSWTILPWRKPLKMKSSSTAATEEIPVKGKEDKEKKGGRSSTVGDNIREKKPKEEQG